ncbi:MAG: hypothetical protein ACK4IX_03560 [Candidatus Sericytochromatia bacterium]
MENYKELGQEIEITIPKDINIKTLNFDISNKGEIFYVGKKDDKVILNLLNKDKKIFSYSSIVIEKGYMPNISISNDQKIIVTWESIDEENDVYELKYKEFNTKLKEKFSYAKVIKSDNFFKFKKPNSYSFNDSLITIVESNDINTQYGVIFAIFNTIYNVIFSNMNYGLEVIYSEKLFSDSNQLNNYSFKNQSNISSDYILTHVPIFINSWESDGQDGDKLGIYAQSFSIEERSFLLLW